MSIDFNQQKDYYLCIYVSLKKGDSIPFDRLIETARFLSSEECEKAIECYEAALHVNPEKFSSQNYSSLADMYLSLRDYQTAEGFARKAVEIEGEDGPDYLLFLNQWAFSLDRIGDRGTATEVYEEIIERGNHKNKRKDGGGYRYHKYVGDYYYDKKYYVKALEYYAWAKGKKPNFEYLQKDNLNERIEKCKKKM